MGNGVTSKKQRVRRPFRHARAIQNDNGNPLTVKVIDLGFHGSSVVVTLRDIRITSMSLNGRL